MFFFPSKSAMSMVESYTVEVLHPGWFLLQIEDADTSVTVTILVMQ